MTQNSMKIAVPSTLPGGLESNVETRFGRCECFTIVEISDSKIASVTVKENGARNAMGGAGPAAVASVSEQGAQAVIGADYGPNALRALQQAGIIMYGYPSPKTYSVKEMVTLFLDEKLPKLG